MNNSPGNIISFFRIFAIPYPAHKRKISSLSFFFSEKPLTFPTFMVYYLNHRFFNTLFKNIK